MGIKLFVFCFARLGLAVLGSIVAPHLDDLVLGLVKPENWADDLLITNGGDHAVPTALSNSRPPLISANSGWNRFRFQAAGSRIVYHLNPHESFSRIVITIVDSFCVGDSFDVFLDGAFIGSTPSVPADGCQAFGTNPQQTVIDWWVGYTNFSVSKLEGELNAKMELAFRVRESPYGGGRAFFRVDHPGRVCRRRNAVPGNFNAAVVAFPRVANMQAPHVCRAQLGEYLEIGSSPVLKTLARNILSFCSVSPTQYHWASHSRAGANLCYAVNSSGDLKQLNCSLELPVICFLPDLV